MGTVRFSCGCAITTSMFGERPIFDASPCMEHALQLQPELKALADKLRELPRTPNY
jgi:hypothetical protein